MRDGPVSTILLSRFPLFCFCCCCCCCCPVVVRRVPRIPMEIFFRQKEKCLHGGGDFKVEPDLNLQRRASDSRDRRRGLVPLRVKPFFISNLHRCLRWTWCASRRSRFYVALSMSNILYDGKAGHNLDRPWGGLHRNGFNCCNSHRCHSIMSQTRSEWDITSLEEPSDASWYPTWHNSQLFRSPTPGRSSGCKIGSMYGHDSSRMVRHHRELPRRLWRHFVVVVAVVFRLLSNFAALASPSTQMSSTVVGSSSLVTFDWLVAIPQPANSVEGELVRQLRGGTENGSVSSSYFFFLMPYDSITRW